MSIGFKDMLHWIAENSSAKCLEIKDDAVDSFVFDSQANISSNREPFFGLTFPP